MAVAMASVDKMASSTSMQHQWQHQCLAVVLVLATAVAAQQAATANGIFVAVE